ncbi:MAG: acetyl-CoA C-acetyltransferase [Armatimonadetes bacterium]|nr:acetyl-CoA C-acetyltransferase [Armatimonadota bacterium]
MPEVVVVSAARSAIGKYLGGLTDIPIVKVAGQVVRAAVEKAGISADKVDEVLMGNVVSAGLGQNPARQAALSAGIPPSVNAVTINKVCGSGLRSVIGAIQAIRCGDAEVAVAGGLESMSQAPYLLEKARTGYRMGHGALVDSMIKDGLWCAFNDFHMGISAELVADRFKISRKEQDEFAVESHKKAVHTAEKGYFSAEIVPISIPQKKGDPVLFQKDESPRADTSEETLARLKPAFKPDGTVTAGNAPGLNDGAAALVLMSKEKAQTLGLKPLARVLGYHVAGLPPEWVMMTPIPAVRGLLQKMGAQITDFDLLELNEAFAVQALSVVRELGADPALVNVHGGAVALGHPIGASGARILVTLIHALRGLKKKRGMASLCMGGGNGIALAVEVL